MNILNKALLEKTFLTYSARKSNVSTKNKVATTTAPTLINIKKIGKKAKLKSKIKAKHVKETITPKNIIFFTV
jgi:hypothetical protein